MSLIDIEMVSFLIGGRVGFKKLNRKYERSEKGYILISLVLRFLIILEIRFLGGYRRCLEGIRLNSGWWIEDYLSTSLISLTLFIVVASLISRDDDFILNAPWESFSFMVILVGVRCLMFFRCRDLFLFFFFFERRLLPTVILILGWGCQPERLQAGLQIVIYTVCGSLPLLVLLGRVWSSGMSDNILILHNLSLNLIRDYIVFWFLLLLGILVKVPVFLVHG